VDGTKQKEDVVNTADEGGSKRVLARAPMFNPNTSVLFLRRKKKRRRQKESDARL